MLVQYKLDIVRWLWNICRSSCCYIYCSIFDYVELHSVYYWPSTRISSITIGFLNEHWNRVKCKYKYSIYCNVWSRWAILTRLFTFAVKSHFCSIYVNLYYFWESQAGRTSELCNKIGSGSIEIATWICQIRSFSQKVELKFFPTV